MAAKRARRRQGRRPGDRERGRRRELGALVPAFLRPQSRTWTHWNRAAVEFLQGVRAALDDCIAAVERSGRRRQAGRLRRIEVQ